MKKLITQSLLLLLSFGLVYGWEQTPLNAYTIQILGFLIFLYLIVSFRKNKDVIPDSSSVIPAKAGIQGPWIPDQVGNDKVNYKSSQRSVLPRGESWTIFILNTIILLFIVSTGGFTSSLFFLLYFVAFGIAFVFEPATVFVFVIGAIAFFLQDALKDDVTRNMIMLGSLALISPLAFFFGKEYRMEEKAEQKIGQLEEKEKQVAEKIDEDVKKVIQNEHLSQEGEEKLIDVIKETETLRP
ncbi:MAG: hypothetical protein Q8P80_05480 [Candidatus Levybacteria bacterium]|nr:hypothetical protein [Candidatus Levybacteria bacterium]